MFYFALKGMIWGEKDIFYSKMKSGALVHSATEESLTVLRMLRCGTSQLMAPGGGGGVGQDSVIFKELVTMSLTMFQ